MLKPSRVLCALVMFEVVGVSTTTQAQNLHRYYGSHWNCSYMSAGSPLEAPCTACERKGQEFYKDSEIDGHCVSKPGSTQSSRSQPSADDDRGSTSRPTVKFTPAEELQFAKQMEAEGLAAFESGNFGLARSKAYTAMDSYRILGDSSRVAAMNDFYARANCRDEEKKAKQSGQANPYRIKQVEAVCAKAGITVLFDASEGGSPQPRALTRDPQSQSTARLDPQAQPQLPGTAANCIGIQQDSAFREFKLTNECSYRVTFKMRSTNFDRSQDWDKVTLGSRSSLSVISYHEEPSIADP